MTVAGFTFIRNAIKFDYPVVEAIKSILPLCDYVVVAVGNSEDDTLSLVKNIDPHKIRIIETIWDDSLREGGEVLAVETNKAFDAISQDADWCFYIQGDEVLHEMYHPEIKNALEKWKNDPDTEGLLFKYRHFYGSYDYIGTARGWYRHEIRIIKNNKATRSYRDAQGFRKNNKKLKVRLLNAFMHHYGWVRPPAKQQLKQLNFNRLWHTDAEIKDRIPEVDEFDYSNTDAVDLFDGTHPAVMQERINQLNWKFSFDPTQRPLPFKEKISRFIEKWTGRRIGEYKNYFNIGDA
jgi:hypothetical protein